MFISRGTVKVHLPHIYAKLEIKNPVRAVWVRDRLQAAGWEVEVADARKVKGVVPLVCKTDKLAWAAARQGADEMLGRDVPGAVAVSIVEAVEPETSLVQGRGTSDCRYEHEPQIRLSPRSLPGGSAIVKRREGGSRGSDL